MYGPERGQTAGRWTAGGMGQRVTWRSKIILWCKENMLGPSSEPALRRVMLHCTWRPSELTTELQGHVINKNTKKTKLHTKTKQAPLKLRKQ